MIESRLVLKYRTGASQRVEDHVVVEEPLEIRVRGKSVTVTMRTPGDGALRDINDAELAAGFLLSEGVIRSGDDIAQITPCAREDSGNVVNVFLRPGVEIDVERLSRHVVASSSCGVCGRATLDALHGTHPQIRGDVQVTPAALSAMPGAMAGAQACFERTGGLHAAGLFETDGTLTCVREDIGRHNAVDKVIGWAVLQGLTPLDARVLLVSGRVSFEIVQKAWAGGLPIVAAVSAPSSLAVALAEDAGITLVGFLRDGRMNVYSAESRIQGD